MFLYTSHDAAVQILHQKIYDTSNNVISERHDVHALFANDWVNSRTKQLRNQSSIAKRSQRHTHQTDHSRNKLLHVVSKTRINHSISVDGLRDTQTMDTNSAMPWQLEKSNIHIQTYNTCRTNNMRWYAWECLTKYIAQQTDEPPIEKISVDHHMMNWQVSL